MMYKIFTLDGKELFIAQVVKTEILNHILYIEFKNKIRADFEECVFHHADAFEYNRCKYKENTIEIPMSQIKDYKQL